VAEHAHEPLPRQPLLVAQHAAQVGEHHQRVHVPTLTELAAPKLPAAATAGERAFERTRRLALEREAESQLRRGRADRPAAVGAQQRLARAVHEPQRALLVERENGGVDLGQDRAQQHGGLERAEASLAQDFAQCVGLGEDQAERVIAAGATRVDRVVLLPQRGEYVRERLQRADHGASQRECEADPDRDQKPDHGDLGHTRDIRAAEQRNAEHERGESARQRQQQHARAVRRSARHRP
jgi:hypothetical protein